MTELDNLPAAEALHRVGEMERTGVAWCRETDFAALLRLARRAISPPTTDTERVRELAEDFAGAETHGYTGDAYEKRAALLTFCDAHDALAARVAEAERVGEEHVLDLVREEWDDDYNADGLIHHVRARLGRKP